jgi:hypothetical protein
MLQTLHYSRANAHGGWCTGRYAVEALSYCGADMRPDDDEHAMGLLQDLTTAGYIEEEDNREDVTQPYGLDHLTYRVAARGIGFVNRTEPPDGLINDGRIIKR